MAKLFPPYIEGTLPAFYQSNGTTKMVVPFVMNRGVRFGEIKGLMMKIKSIQSNTYLYSTKNDEGFFTENSAQFTLPAPIESSKKTELTTTIENAKIQLENIQTKKTLLEKISSYFEKLKELENQQESIDVREDNKKFYENRIAEISNYYLQSREDYATLTMEEKIKLLEKVKTQKIIDLGKNGAYYDIQNVNIAKNFYNIVKNLNSEIAELQNTNSEIVTNQILEAIRELVDDNYLSFVNRVSNDYSDFNNLQNILFLEDNSDVIRINNKIVEQEKIITDATTELESFTSEDLKPGLFYKVQLAYINQDDEIGQYSTIGVIKYTTMPEVTIEGMSAVSINTTWHEFKGIYHQDPNNGDTSEHVYSYQFDFYDTDHNLIDSSGTLLHNSTTDPNGYESYDSYYFSQSLGVEEVYYVQYTITTQNGLVVSSPEYAVMEKFSINIDIAAKLIAELNYDNGYIGVNLVGYIPDGYPSIPSASGHFILARANSETNFNVWEKIFTFSLLNEEPTKLLWRDYTIEQGKSYQYSIQQYNDNGVYSSRLLSNLNDENESIPVFADFEDMFLSDGKRQLKIRFNPKVSTFKNDILEQKVDTIGSKYPFFFRNGNVYYKEFQISGLISRLMDEEELFFNWDIPDMSCRHDTVLVSKGGSSIYGYHETKSELIPIEQQVNASSGREIDKTINLKTNITSDNIYNERQFKLEVLTWLNNGEPKIFRSPAEGNYIVRLMNVSLSPEDKLSRMLHNFQCTAYEVDDFNYNNLTKNNFLQTAEQIEEILMYKTVQFYTDDENGNRTFKTGTIISDEVTGFWIHDCQPGEKFYVVTSDNKTIDIVIGSTGQYIMEYPTLIQSFSINGETQSSGQITYSYYAKPKNNFDDLEKVDVLDIYCKQFINKDENPYNIFDKLLKPTWHNKYYNSQKISLNKIYYIKIQSWLDEETYYDYLNIETNNNNNNNDNLYFKQGAIIRENDTISHSNHVINFNNSHQNGQIVNLKLQIPYGERINHLQLVHCGKNLLPSVYPITTINGGVVSGNDAHIVSSDTGKVFTLPCNINQDYVFSNIRGSWWKVGFIDKEYPQVDDHFKYECMMASDWDWDTNTENYNFILVQMQDSAFNNLTENGSMIEIGTTKTVFEPYNGQTYDIDIPTDVDFYGGEIDLLNGELISKYDSDGNLLSSPIVKKINGLNLIIKEGINNLFVYGCNNRADIELSYFPFDNEQFISVRDKPYFIPITKINSNDIQNGLYLYPQTELEIGYQIINKTYEGEIERVNPETQQTYYQEYQDALQNFEVYINGEGSQNWAQASDEDTYLDPSNYNDWANKDVSEEDILLNEIQRTKNNYEIDVIRYRYYIEKERNEDLAFESSLIISNNNNQQKEGNS